MRFQHRAMLGVWWKTLVPHRIWQRKAMQTKNATAFNCSLVEILKQIPPHKEKKTNTIQSA
jgi:hypothetical protein